MMMTLIALSDREPYIPAERTIPATLKALGELGGHTRAFVFSCATHDAEATAGALELAVHEIGVNIVRHAYDSQGGWLSIAYRIEGDDLVVTLTDAGRPFEPEDAVEPDPDQPTEGGYGLFLVAQLVDDLTYTRTRDRNRWELRVGRTGRRAAAG